MFLLMGPTDHIPGRAHGPLDFGRLGVAALCQGLVDISTVFLPGLGKNPHNQPSLDVCFVLKIRRVRSLGAHTEFYVKPCNLKSLVWE